MYRVSMYKKKGKEGKMREDHSRMDKGCMAQQVELQERATRSNSKFQPRVGI